MKIIVSRRVEDGKSGLYALVCRKDEEPQEATQDDIKKTLAQYDDSGSEEGIVLIEVDDAHPFAQVTHALTALNSDPDFETLLGEVITKVASAIQESVDSNFKLVHRVCELSRV